MLAPIGCVVEEEIPQKYIQLTDVLNIQYNPISIPKAFEDTQWLMGIDSSTQMLELYVHCENYDNSKTFDVDGIIRCSSDSTIDVVKTFKMEFNTDQNRINVPMFEVAKIRRDQDLILTVSLLIQKKNRIRKILVLPPRKNLIHLIFPDNRTIFVKKSLLRSHSHHFENLDLDINAVIGIDEKLEEFSDVLEIIDPMNWKKSGMINQKNIGYSIRLAKKYNMPVVLEKCEEYLKTNMEIQKEDIVVLANQYKLTGVMNSLMGRFKTQEEIEKFQDSEIYKNLEAETKSAFSKKIELMKTISESGNETPSEEYTRLRSNYHEMMARFEPSEDIATEFSRLRIGQQTPPAPLREFHNHDYNPFIPLNNQFRRGVVMPGYPVPAPPAPSPTPDYENQRRLAREFQNDEYIRFLHHRNQQRRGIVMPGYPGQFPAQPTPWYVRHTFGPQLQCPPAYIYRTSLNYNNDPNRNPYAQ